MSESSIHFDTSIVASIVAAFACPARDLRSPAKTPTVQHIPYQPRVDLLSHYQQMKARKIAEGQYQRLEADTPNVSGVAPSRAPRL